ncbi:MAG: hypothetical protein EAZ30_01150 [Betaproteobacteria bacterium]|nr:MAG: hypothetical protein EAZ30_01150 [Betaproteobacteria bacterium]
MLAFGSTSGALAQVCPFDNGGSTLTNDGLVLTRYALGLRGSPMVANTSFAAADAATIESNIACPACGLRVTDDRDALNNPIFTVADATIISRKLAGFDGASLTNGIPSLGVGTRNSPTAVQSFLLSGCGATGGTVTSVTAGTGLTGGTVTVSGTIAADTNFLQRRVSTACATGRYITSIAADGTPTCGLPPAGGSGTVTSVGAGTGLVANGANVVGGAIVSNGLMELANGFILPQGCTNGQIPKSIGGGTWTCAADNVGTTVTNTFTQGGNAFGAPAVLGTTDGQPLTVGIGSGRGLRILPAVDASAPNVINGAATNTIGNSGGQLRGVTVAGGASNRVGTPDGSNGWYSTIGGGRNNKTGKDDNSGGDNSTVAGGVSNTASGNSSTVAGGSSNTASGVSSTVGGGGGNIASSGSSTVAGGLSNTASGALSTVAGGQSNTASGDYSFAAGRQAKAAGQGSFVWADSTPLDYNAGAGNGPSNANSFNVRATGGVNIVTAVDGTGVPTKGLSVDVTGTARADSLQIAGVSSTATLKVGAAGSAITGIQAGRASIAPPGQVALGQTPDPSGCNRGSIYTVSCYVDRYFAFPTPFAVGQAPRVVLTLNYAAPVGRISLSAAVINADNIGVSYRVTQHLWSDTEAFGPGFPDLNYDGLGFVGWVGTYFVDWIAIAQ